MSKKRLLIDERQGDLFSFMNRISNYITKRRCEP